MTYYAGICFGPSPSNPRVECDGCGLVKNINTPPPAWFLDGKAVPGWRMKRTESETGVVRRDYCATCKRAREVKS